MIIHSPITPLSASAKEDNKVDPFDKLFHQQQNDLLQNGLYGNMYAGHNVPPPLPFFPTPQAYDQMQQRRNSAANRRRASSLHQPVLETILGSPVMGSEVKEITPIPMITVKVRTESTNFMIKIPKSSTLRDVKGKIADKIESSGLVLTPNFELAVLASANASSGSTAKGSKALESKLAPSTDAEQQRIHLEDEEDWLLAVSLASKKITLQICS